MIYLCWSCKAPLDAEDDAALLASGWSFIAGSAHCRSCADRYRRWKPKRRRR